ncbi:DUF6965 family protein [Sphingobacterium sp. LRF_L2]|uniref:DUF6965 family protein n=1 Tax=Sphingobacterium sp. LRF_L2 TaxID=3369421 RepID=UPI003F602BF1
MTIEELKQAFAGKQFIAPIAISEDQIVVDVDQFLKIQFIMVDLWKKDLSKSPAYVRLLKFYEATK